ncbi:hypothetical protein G7Z17_g5593 [Cylindrodendrum hubeiense]|uniref:Uncharacterized protein n=1 Tax=Cylindrodendrum hubeiense TaxID=595255 RepID=A0A9P5H8N7_9HYPO|nr:hypothetical protein G7Z17_g5593 [Cylindrodendrum hubeiense]
MSEAPGALLKTCQTCFHAKIRCEKTQDSGLCDSSGAAAGAGAAAGVSAALGAGRIDQPEASSSTTIAPSIAPSQPQTASDNVSVSDASSSIHASQERLETTSPYSPFTRGMLTLEKGQEYLDIFRNKMTPYFPFVLVPDTVSIRDLDRDRPCLCLAVMCATSYSDPKLQEALGEHFNDMIATRLVQKDWFASALWSLQEELMKRNGPKLTTDEMRALAGTYYLASRVQNDQPTDKYLPYIIYLQKLTEELDDAVSMSQNSEYLTIELKRIKEMYVNTKSTLPFMLSECPTIQLQLQVLELLICQPSPDSVTLGPNGFQNVQGAASSNGLLDWLSQSLAAAKSLITVFLTLPHGAEGLMPNMNWIVLYSTASLSVRLDLLAVYYEQGHLRRILDLPYTLRQIVLRLEAAAGLEDGSEPPRNAFSHLATKGQQIERWYIHRTSHTSSPSMGSMLSSSDSSPPSFPPTETSTEAGITSSSNLVPDVGVTSDQNMVAASNTDNFWTATRAVQLDPDITMGNMLFTGDFDFSLPTSGSTAGPTGGFRFYSETDTKINMTDFDSGV